MEELFKRFLDFLPVPLLLTVAAVVALAWLIKQLRPNSEYGEVLRDRIFRRTSIGILAILLVYLCARASWIYLTASDFRAGERGICVAQFKDDRDNVLQRHTVEQLRALISENPSLATVRIEPYSSIVSSDSEARELAGGHGAVATIWGSVISGLGANIAVFQVTPRYEQHGFSKICPKYPDVGDFTQGFVAFVGTSIPAASTRQEDAQNSYIQQQFQELKRDNQRLANLIDQLQSRISASEVPKNLEHPEGVSSGSLAQTLPRVEKRRFGIFIGVDKYESLGSQLVFASADARAMAEAFRANSSFPNVTLLSSNATREQVLSRMAEVSQQAQSGDQVWLYFSGIGFRDGSGEGESSYLALAGTQAANLTASSLSSDDLLHWIKGLKARQVMVLLDACHSGLGVLHRGPGTPFNLRQIFTLNSGSVLLAAGQADQLAFEDPKLGHGIFTYYVLQGLSGKASVGGSDYVTANELFAYVRSEVSGHSAGRIQVPWLGVIDGTGDFIVADVTPSARTR